MNPNTLLTLFILTMMGLLLACESDSSTTADGESGNVALPVAAANNGGISLPADFGAALVTDTLGMRVRHLAVRDNGDIYVKAARGEGGHAVIGLRDSDGDGRADEQVSWGDYDGTGVEIFGEYLYVSSDEEVYRYRLTDQLLPDTVGETIVTGLPEQRSHEAKSLALDGEGNLYVNIGAPSNSCQEQNRQPGSPGMDPCPILETQGGIWRFSADSPNQTQEQGTRYATGLRNCVAIHWDNHSQSLYAVQHGRDQLHGLFPETFTVEQNAMLPAEEFFQVSEGDDFGWPYCYYDGQQGKKVLAPEYGGDGEEIGRCADKKDPLVGFPGHMAPNDLHFYQGDLFPERYKHGAFIAFHGSWNRAPEPQGGYFVAFVPMENGQPSGDWEIFAEGFPQIETVESPGDAVYRPMGLSEGPDGSLYVSDSVNGRIWRIMYYGQKMAIR